MSTIKKFFVKTKTFVLQSLRIVVILAIVFGVGIGYMVGVKYQLRSDSGFVYTNPILDYEEGAFLMNNKHINLEQEIEAYLELKKARNKTTHISVYFKNLNNGNRFGVNEREQFSPASLMKLPLLMAYYKKAEQYPNLLKEKILYIPDPNEQSISQNIRPQKTLTPYEKYSVKDLLNRMIVYSDNKASILLENLISLEEYEKVFTDIGIKFPEFKNGMFENNINIVDYASFFRVLYNSSYLNRKDSEYVLHLLKNTKFKSGIVDGVPSSILVSHKFGEREIANQKQLHDCGIVYYPNHAYLLCVMTRGNNREYLKEIIAGISEKIYKEVDEVYTNQ